VGRAGRAPWYGSAAPRGGPARRERSGRTARISTPPAAATGTSPRRAPGRFRRPRRRRRRPPSQAPHPTPPPHPSPRPPRPLSGPVLDADLHRAYNSAGGTPSCQGKTGYVEKRKPCGAYWAEAAIFSEGPLGKWTGSPLESPDGSGTARGPPRVRGGVAPP